VTLSKAQCQLPASLSDVALIDGPTAAMAAGMSVSQFRQEVRDGHAPQPAIRRPRYTRWTIRQIRAWLESLADASPVAGAASHEAQDQERCETRWSSRRTAPFHDRKKGPR